MKKGLHFTIGNKEGILCALLLHYTEDVAYKSTFFNRYNAKTSFMTEISHMLEVYTLLKNEKDVDKKAKLLEEKVDVITITGNLDEECISNLKAICEPSDIDIYVISDTRSQSSSDYLYKMLTDKNILSIGHIRSSDNNKNKKEENGLIKFKTVNSKKKPSESGKSGVSLAYLNDISFSLQIMNSYIDANAAFAFGLHLIDNRGESTIMLTDLLEGVYLKQVESYFYNLEIPIVRIGEYNMALFLLPQPIITDDVVENLFKGRKDAKDVDIFMFIHPSSTPKITCITNDPSIDIERYISRIYKGEGDKEFGYGEALISSDTLIHFIKLFNDTIKNNKKK